MTNQKTKMIRILLFAFSFIVLFQQQMIAQDDGRTVDDSRTDGEQEYKRPPDCTTWTLFYKHLMTEHTTRQIWSELTIDPNLEVKPGAVIKIDTE